jgi:inorganic pyrophosphatase
VNPNTTFWQAFERLLAENAIVIDRPKGQPHPRYPEMIYPLDYGYIADTTSGDGDGIDIWTGSQENKSITGILCTFDALKRDAEIKLLVGCSTQDVENIMQFHRPMHCLYIPKP